MILVTGGRGFVGRHLVKALSGGSEAVRVLTRSASPAEGMDAEEVMIGDLSEAASVNRAVDGVRVVIHLAARVKYSGHDAGVYAANVHTTATLAAASRDACVQQFIHISSGGVYGDGTTAAPHRETDRALPGDAYERSKLAAEEMVVKALSPGKTAFTMLRCAGIYGHGRAATRSFFEEVRRRRAWIHGTPNVVVHPTHVMDVVQACHLVLDRRCDLPTVVNIAGERALPFQDYVTLVAATLGVSVRQWIVPSTIGRPAARAAAAGMRLIGATVPASVDRMSRAWINRALDISLAQRVLGFTPMPLRDGLRQAAEAMRADTSAAEER